METFIAELSAGVAGKWVLMEEHPILQKNGKISLLVKHLADQIKDGRSNNFAI